MAIKKVREKSSGKFFNYDTETKTLTPFVRTFQPLEMVGNIPKSAVGVGKAMITPLTSPLDTIEGISRIAAGGMEKLTGSDVREKDVAAFDNMTKMFKDRYGGVDNMLKTLEEDPIGVLADLSGVLTAGGSVITGVGRLGSVASKMAKVGEVGVAAAGVSKIATPLGGIGSVAGKLNAPSRRITAPGISTIDSSRSAGGMLGEIGSEATKATGRGISDVGKFIDPVSLGVKGLGLTGKMGQFPILKTATSPVLVAAMRGKTSGEDILKGFGVVLENIKKQRSDNIDSVMKEVGKISEPLDITQVKMMLETRLNDFNVTRNAPTQNVASALMLKKELKRKLESLDELKAYQSKDVANTQLNAGIEDLTKQVNDLSSKIKSSGKQSTLNFRGSRVPNKTEQKILEDFVDFIDNYGSDPKETLTPSGLDTLKVAVDNFYTETEKSLPSNAIVVSVRKSLNDLLVKEVPGYEKAMDDYGKSSELIKGVAKAVDIGDTASIDEALTKITKALNGDALFGKGLMESLKTQGNQKLLEELLGYSRRKFVPSTRAVIVGAGAMTGLIGFGYAKYSALLAVATPRTLGEFLTAAGKSLQAAEKLSGKLEKLTPYSQPSFQMGRIGMQPQYVSPESMGRQE